VVTRLALLVALAGGGCTLFDELPDRSCKTNNDCFRAQGERCNTATRRCELAPDAGTSAVTDEDAP
jgi:hypothetical protein